jgi:hypothetical protein
MADGTNEEVTLEGLDSALTDLVKAAEATDLVKGGLEHSGRVDEKGKGGGGHADYSDAGGLDNMMVGKMASAGVPADMIADFGEFLAGKAKGDDEDEEDEDEDEENQAGFKGKKYGKSDAADFDSDIDDEPMQKSMDSFREDSDIASALDVSPYLEAMTMRTAEQIDDMRKSLTEQAGSQFEVNRRQAAALYQIGSLVKAQSAVVEALGQRLGLVERTPNAPKGATSAPTAQAMAKSMPGEAGAAGGEQLKKSEVLSVLSYMNLEKGIKTIGQQSTVEAIGLLEGGGRVSEDVIRAAHDFVTSNPTIEKEARSYS